MSLMTPSQDELQAQLERAAERLQVPGAAVGVYHAGTELYAVYGVTSRENPLPVTEDTLFQFGSTGKTLTATTVMVLADRGEVRLDAPVQTYVPEFRVLDEDASRTVTVLQLLNHSAGWQGDLFVDTGMGDDAIARYVERMADLEQVTPVGATASYNNASLVLAGRVIEKVSGETYEAAVTRLVLEPLGLEHTLALLNDVMTRRFALGHLQRPDGTIETTRPWIFPRAITPAGCWSASIRDQVAWARFHLGEGRNKDGQPLLARETLARMQEPTFAMGGGVLGDYCGITWLMEDVGGVRVVGHSGSTPGQASDLRMVPARDFAVSVLTNLQPYGAQLYTEMIVWALERFLGVVEKREEALMLSDAELEQYVGSYETIRSWLHVSCVDGGLQVIGEPKERDPMRENDPSQPEAFPISLLPEDRFVLSSGGYAGMKGYFARDQAGLVTGINFGGRLATRAALRP